MNGNDPVGERARLGRWMIFAMWVGALALLTLGFGRWLDLDHNPNGDLDSRNGGPPGEVVLVRNRAGHYVASGAINGQPVVFMVDTGSTDVSVPEALAGRLGLRRGAPLSMETAGGVVMPMISPGFTDSRIYRQHGVPAIGYTPALLTMDELGGIHGNDERISTQNLRLGTRLLLDTVRRAAGQP